MQLLSVADTSKHFSLQFRPCLGGNLYQCLERRECCNEQDLAAKVGVSVWLSCCTSANCGCWPAWIGPMSLYHVRLLAQEGSTWRSFCKLLAQHAEPFLTHWLLCL